MLVAVTLGREASATGENPPAHEVLIGVALRVHARRQVIGRSLIVKAGEDDLGRVRTLHRLLCPHLAALLPSTRPFTLENPFSLPLLIRARGSSAHLGVRRIARVRATFDPFSETPFRVVGASLLLWCVDWMTVASRARTSCR